MIETVFALILTLNGSMIEHTYKNSLSDCLKSKRLAQNEVNPERVVFTCKKVKAKTEIWQAVIPQRSSYHMVKKVIWSPQRFPSR